MYKSLLLFSVTMLSFWQCTERVSEPNKDDITNRQMLTWITPSQYGNEIDTGEGVFIDALFIDYQVADVWAVYTVRNGIQEKLSLEIDFDNSLKFIMFTDKYIDQNQLSHYAVYTAVPEDTLNPIDNVLIVVSEVQEDELISKYFETVPPMVFGEIIHTVQGDFIEAFFKSVSAAEVWGIQQTLAQGTKARINIARKLNRYLSYYLINDTRQDSLGNTVNGIKVGLPYTPLSPLQNIEIFISKPQVLPQDLSE